MNIRDMLDSYVNAKKLLEINKANIQYLENLAIEELSLHSPVLSFIPKSITNTVTDSVFDSVMKKDILVDKYKAVIIEQEWRIGAVEAILYVQSDNDRKILELKHFQKKSNREIAEKIEGYHTKDSVRRGYKRILKNIEKMFE